MFTMRTLAEGKWALLILALLTAAGWLWQPYAAVVPLVLLAFTFSFYRDPRRAIAGDAQDLVAPGDGRIVEIINVSEPLFLKGEATRIAIFLTVFDVHVQRSPMTGTIKFVKYEAGKFLDVRHPHASAHNESRYVGIEGADGCRVMVRQIAGLIARRIVGWVDEGAALQKGQHIGMIRFGSRVELFVPVGTEVKVKVGDYAKGGETILARRT